MKICCKNCTELRYDDKWYCLFGKELNNKNINIDYIIEDVYNTKCEMFIKNNE